MPLIDLQTNLKSLKFPGRAPYVTKDINNPPVYGALSHELTARVDDVSRLVQMLTDKPGVEFIAKQALLQASDPNNFKSDKQTILGRAIDNAGNVVKDTARTVGTIIAQAGINRTGIHFISPSPEYYYTSQAAAGQAAAGSTIANDVVRVSNQIGKVSKYGYNEIVNSAAVNVNNTDISDRANTLSEYTKPTQASLDAQAGNPITVKTFRNRVTKNNDSSLDTKYGFAGSGKSDAVGIEDIHNDSAKIAEADLVPLSFSRFQSGEYKVFRGFLGSINDSYNANWSGNQFVGRMEQFFIYTGFSRTLSFNFNVPIFSEKEQPIVYNKVNALLSHTAPYYPNPNSAIAQGVITELQIGDYIQTAGVLNSISVTLSEDVPWSYGPGKEPLLLPQLLRLQIQFTPIHKKTPQYYGKPLTEEGTEMPYIATSTKKIYSGKQTQAELAAEDRRSQTEAREAQAVLDEQARITRLQQEYREQQLDNDIEMYRFK